MTTAIKRIALSVTPLQLKILQKLWQEGPLRYKDIRQTVIDSDGVERSRNAIYLLLNNLEQKGWIRVEKTGKKGCSSLYHASITSDELRRDLRKSVPPEFIKFLTAENETDLSNRHLINYPSLIQVIDAQSQVLALDGKS